MAKSMDYPWGISTKMKRLSGRVRLF